MTTVETHAVATQPALVIDNAKQALIKIRPSMKSWFRHPVELEVHAPGAQNPGKPLLFCPLSISEETTKSHRVLFISGTIFDGNEDRYCLVTYYLALDTATIRLLRRRRLN